MGDYCLRVGIKIRAALTSAVAKKAFAMESVKKELSAEIVSFIATDIHKACPHRSLRRPTHYLNIIDECSSGIAWHWSHNCRLLLG